MTTIRIKNLRNGEAQTVLKINWVSFLEGDCHKALLNPDEFEEVKHFNIPKGTYRKIVSKVVIRLLKTNIL